MISAADIAEIREKIPRDCLVKGYFVHALLDDLDQARDEVDKLEQLLTKAIALGHRFADIRAGLEGNPHGLD